MLQCHECGCDIPPGDAVRREVVLSTTSTTSAHGSATHVQYGSVALCPKCVQAADERLNTLTRSTAAVGAVIFGVFVALVACAYFFIVKPSMDDHERRRQQMDANFEKARQEQDGFRKKHFGN